MTNQYKAAETETMYFIGVTTGKSAIMKVFPAWAKSLQLNAMIKGFDFPPNDKPDHYREVVEFIKNDPNSMGALVTTHKLNLLKTSRDLFDGLCPYAQILDEVSCISKRGNELWGHAKDPITAGLALEAIVDKQYWTRSRGQLLIIGAGGSSLALTLYLHNKIKEGGDVPSRIIVNNRSEKRLEEMKAVHKKINIQIPIEYNLVPTPEENDSVVKSLVSGSMIINATGLGKDRPGSPLTDAVDFPEKGIIWEFNYRGELIFLDQANANKEKKQLRIEDGWLYFIHGWTRVIAEVFHIEIPTTGPELEKLSDIAEKMR
jgi:shikimate 5-dehydrogenase